MKKIIITVLISLLFIVPVKALEVNYTGNNEISVDSETLFDIEEVYPGDTLESNITIKNTSDEEKEIYIKIENENNKLTNLTLEITNDDNEIYNGGLTLSNIEEYILLDTYKSNSESNLKVKLNIPTTIDNNSSLDELSLKIGFYIIEDDEYVQIDEVVTNPKTGDSITKYIVLFGISLISIILLIILLIKNNKKQEN